MAAYRYQHGDRPLDGYTIEYGLGRGGFGEVYYAVSDAGRQVALKIVQNYEEIELRGIRQCMNLKSPHLVTIFDVRRNERDEPFVIMEYVDGPSLRQLLDESPQGLGADKSAHLLREIGKGLRYLHESGVVHRDLKPHNVFLESGYVKIGDYSLSKLISTSHRSGHTVTVGTVHYMAPEISEGRYDARVDIYALGIMLFEMLTGRPPFEGQSMGEILLKHVTAKPNLSQIQEPFHSVIAKALAKNPDERFANVDQMIHGIASQPTVEPGVTLFRSEELVNKAAAAHAMESRLRNEQRDGELPPELPLYADQRVSAKRGNYAKQAAGRSGGPSTQDDSSIGQGWHAADSSNGFDLTQDYASSGDIAHRTSESATIGERIDRWHSHLKVKSREFAARAGVLESFDRLEKQDELSVERRTVLAVCAAAALAVGAAIMNRMGLAEAWCCFAVIATSTFALFLVRHAVFPRLQTQQRVLGRLVAVAACLAALPLALVCCAPALIVGRVPDGFLPSAFIGISTMAAINVRHHTEVARQRRITLWLAIAVAMIAFVWASNWQVEGVLSAGIAAGIALTMQVSSPFRGANSIEQATGASAAVNRATDGVEFRQQPYAAEPFAAAAGPMVASADPHAAIRVPDAEVVLASYAQPAPATHGEPPPTGGDSDASEYTRWAAFALSILFFATGLGGLHRFYVGRWVSGVIWLCTGGLLGIGQLIDTILILTGGFRDVHGRLVSEWEKGGRVRLQPVNQLSGVPLAQYAESPHWVPMESSSQGRGRVANMLGWCGAVAVFLAMSLLASLLVLCVLVRTSGFSSSNDRVFGQIVAIASVSLSAVGGACLLASRMRRGRWTVFRTVGGGIGTVLSLLLWNGVSIAVMDQGMASMPLRVTVIWGGLLLFCSVLLLYPSRPPILRVPERSHGRQ